MKKRITSLLLTLALLLPMFMPRAVAYNYGTAFTDPPAVAERIVYGQSGAGRDLVAYRFGTGENVMVLGFAIHGFEDNFDRDGLALVYTADLLMDLLGENMDMVDGYGWSIYVLPCMNPDGLLDGYSCNGPGRCTTTYLSSSGNLVTGYGKGIDMNRSFPYGWTRRTDERNFNGAVPLASLESRALAQFIQEVKGTGQNICIDAHGWFSQIITSNGSSSKLFQIFRNAFPGNTYANCMNGSGYFTAYAGSIGYTACLFEFPNVYSMSQFQSSGYPEAFNRCILQLAAAYGTWREPTPDPEIPHEDYCPAADYPDLSVGAWYHEAVDFTLYQEYFQGIAPQTFAPEMSMTRAMLVTVLYRMSGDTTEGETDFPDVERGSWYAPAVAWAEEHQIVTGFPDGTFRPEEEITREQMVTILCRYAGWSGISTALAGDLNSFSDWAQVGDYAADAMGWACATGVIHGAVIDGEARLNPLTGASRAEVAQILCNYCGSILGMDTAIPAPTDSVSATREILSTDWYDETFTPADGEDLGGN